MAGGSKFMNVIRVLIGTKTTTKKPTVRGPCATVRDPCATERDPCADPCATERDPCATQHDSESQPPAVTRFEVHPPKMIQVVPTRWQWHKTKDLFHFYLMVGLIPVAGILFYSNVFIGQAELAEIPEDYIPKHWEYHRHPVKRFLAQYVYPDPQQEYEKLMHNIYEEDEKMKIRLLEKKIRAKMAERNDYQAWYYRPTLAKYVRVSKEAADYLKTLTGD